MATETHDIIILGTGPAGLQAAIHAARAKASVLVLGRAQQSSLYKAEIENYCCVTRVSGDELLAQGREQARHFGAAFLEEDCVKAERDSDGFTIVSESGKTFRCAVLIFTLGISRNKLGVPGESNFKGQGVSYCVECDAPFYAGKAVAVTGGGSAAVTGALTLLSYARIVHLVADRLDITPDLEATLKRSEVRLHLPERVREITGAASVERVVLSGGESLEVDGIFIELGAKGALELAGFLGVGMDDDFKHIATNKKQETDVPGIYAAGDICGPPWQLAKAIGEGCVAGVEAAAFVRKQRNK